MLDSARDLRFMVSDKLIGRVLHDTHRIIRRVGQGGMGAVYEAEHVRLSNKRFAIKVLHGQALEDERVYARFRREAQIATDLGHPNIVDVTDFYETSDGLPCMVMELLRGKNLEQVLRERGRLHTDEVQLIMRQVGGALQAAHDQGVIHRDLKPANIFLTSSDGEAIEAKLLDFGISKIRDSQTKLTGNRDILGTPHYMSPEQGSGEADDVDQGTDIFALGIICYEALTGRLPFDAPTMLGVIYKICKDEPPPPSSLWPELPAALDDVLSRALAKEREARHPRVFDFVHELHHALPAVTGAGLPPTAEPLEPLARSLMRSAAPVDAPGEISVTPSAAKAAAKDAAEAKAKAWLQPNKQTTMSGSAGEASLAEPGPPGGRGRLIAVVLAALVVASSLIWWSQRGAHRSSTRLAAGRVDGAIERVAPAPPAAADAAPAATQPSRRVQITLKISPASAQVLLDGIPRKDNPLQLEASEEPRTLRVEAPGHRPDQQRLTPDRDKRVVVTLKRAGAGRRPIKKSAPAPQPKPEPKPKPKPEPKPKSVPKGDQDGFDKL